VSQLTTSLSTGYTFNSLVQNCCQLSQKNLFGGEACHYNTYKFEKMKMKKDKKTKQNVGSWVCNK
jgi:hypothetical protein